MTENGADVRIVLALETSCDETAVALLDGAGRVRASRIASQEDAHRLFGGVVPEIAARAHLENLPPLLDAALADAGVTLTDVSAVAATAGPGLVGALLVGLSEGKGLALGLGVPFVPVNHVEGHALSPFLSINGGAAASPTRSCRRKALRSKAPLLRNDTHCPPSATGPRRPSAALRRHVT